MSRSAAELLGLLRDHRLRVFTTSDVVTLTGLHRPAATHALRRLAARRLVTRIKRGLWINALADDVVSYELVPHLAAPWPAYVSLHSALADAGVIQEIPHVVYAVTAGRARRDQTPLGTVEFHHLPARLLWGYAMRQQGRATYPVAEPEKAFLDLAYLALLPRSGLHLPPRRGRTWPLDHRTVTKYAAHFGRPALTTLVKTLFRAPTKKRG